MDTRQRIRCFLAQFIPDHQFDDEDNLFANGHFNSLFVMQLVLFVENELGFAVTDEYLEFENFSSVAAIARMVDGREDPEVVT